MYLSEYNEYHIEMMLNYISLCSRNSLKLNLIASNQSIA